MRKSCLIIGKTFLSAENIASGEFEKRVLDLYRTIDKLKWAKKKKSDVEPKYFVLWKCTITELV